jgi:DNA-binding transcriptional MocR family regulator
MPPPLMSEIFTLLVEDGSIDTIIERHREEAAARADVARRMLKRTGALVSHASYSLWLRLPEPWHADAFVQAARLKGVLVMPASAFAVGRHAHLPQAVRVSLGGMNDRENIRRGLRALSRLLMSGVRAR